MTVSGLLGTWTGSAERGFRIPEAGEPTDKPAQAEKKPTRNEHPKFGYVVPGLVQTFTVSKERPKQQASGAEILHDLCDLRG